MGLMLLKKKFILPSKLIEILILHA